MILCRAAFPRCSSALLKASGKLLLLCMESSRNTRLSADVNDGFVKHISACFYVAQNHELFPCLVQFKCLELLRMESWPVLCWGCPIIIMLRQELGRQHVPRLGKEQFAMVGMCWEPCQL